MEVEGSFDNWTTRQTMQRSGKDFTIVKLLPPGVYQVLHHNTLSSSAPGICSHLGRGFSRCEFRCSKLCHAGLLAFVLEPLILRQTCRLQISAEVVGCTPRQHLVAGIVMSLYCWQETLLEHMPYLMSLSAYMQP